MLTLRYQMTIEWIKKNKTINGLGKLSGKVIKIERSKQETRSVISTYKDTSSDRAAEHSLEMYYFPENISILYIDNPLVNYNFDSCTCC